MLRHLQHHSSESLGIPQLTRKTGALFVFFTGGVVFLTLIVNGSTAQFLLHFLGMDKTSDSKMQIVQYIRSEMKNKALEKLGELGEDEELGPDDRQSVCQRITCLKTEEGHCISINENEQHRMDKQDTRLLLLNGVQAAYWRMLCEGKITQTTAILLMRSIDEAVDMVYSRNKLVDWERLEAYLEFAGRSKCFQIRCLPLKLQTFFTVEKSRLACYICMAFLRAHKTARRQLRNIGESIVDKDVIRESKEEGDLATQFLRHVEVEFPQVLPEVRRKSVTYCILLHLSEYVQNLRKSGLLEAKEMDHLHEVVEMDLKRLLGKESFGQKFRALFYDLQRCFNYGSQLRELELE